MTHDLTIDKEFASRLRPLTDNESQLLEQQLVDKGCLDPIKIWANHRHTIVDGHNRYRFCKKHGIKFDIKPLMFSSREDVLRFIDETNAGRRNLTATEIAKQRGDRYKAEVLEVGTNRFTNGRVDTVSTLQDERTCERLSSELGVSDRTIRRDAKLADAIDKICEASEEAAAAILSEEVDMTRKQIASLANKDKDEIIAKIDELKNGKKPEPKEKKKDGRDTSWPAMLKWASKRRKPVTKDDLAEHFDVIDTDCRKRLATACQTTSSRFMVMDLGDGNYRVISAAMIPIEGDDKSFADLWKDIRMMAEYGLKQIHASESGGWSRDHQMKFVGSVLALAKEYTGG